MSTTKRKSDASASTSTKKARMTHTAAIESVRSILADTSNFTVPESDDETRRALLELARYARSLEEQVLASKPKEKSAMEVEGAAEKLRLAARSSIRKQMTVGLFTVASLRYVTDLSASGKHPAKLVQQGGHMMAYAPMPTYLGRYLDLMALRNSRRRRCPKMSFCASLVT
jgi:hypothetical protein